MRGAALKLLSGMTEKWMFAHMYGVASVVFQELFRHQPIGRQIKITCPRSITCRLQEVLRDVTCRF